MLSTFGIIAAISTVSMIAAPYAAPVGLAAVGFTKGGVMAGSVAAAWQATIGNVAAGSAFATLQSVGAAGIGAAGTAIAAVSGATVAGVATGVVSIVSMPIGPTIDKIELKRDNAIWFRTPSWYAEHVEIESLETKDVYFFPIHRWIVQGRFYTFKQYDTVLPQGDEQKEQRHKELKEKKKDYEYHQMAPGFPVMVKKIPDAEKWKLDTESHTRTRALKLSIEKWFTKINTVFHSWSSINDIEQLYESVHWGVFSKPKHVIDKWSDDKWFGAQRLCGVHPFVIEQCTKIPDNLGITEEDLKSYCLGDDDMTLEKAIEKKRLYIVDLKTNEEIGVQNELEPYGPIALFFVNDDKDLMPIAIQLHQEKGPDNPVFYPKDDENLWTIAKMWFNMADGFYHQAVTHFATCHMIVEGIAVCTHRNLSPSHPIYKLLMPHFQGTMAINNSIMTGSGDLINESHRIQGKGLNALRGKGFGSFQLDVHSDLLNDLKKRGVDDEDNLPNYHYRDDALLIWFAILNYAEKIIKHFYADDDTVLGDTEIQQWGEELTKPYPEGIGLKGVAGDGKFKTRDEVTAVCLQIIYTASVKHCANHYPSYDAYAWSPNRPTWLRGAPPKNKNPLTKACVMNTLPTKDSMLATMQSVSSELADDNNLGHFLITYFHSPEAKEIHKEFLKELKEISEKIKERNDFRKYKYEWLDPEHVANSIYV